MNEEQTPAGTVSRTARIRRIRPTANEKTRIRPKADKDQ